MPNPFDLCIITVDGGYSIDSRINISMGKKYPDIKKTPEDSSPRDSFLRRCLVAANAPFKTREEAHKVMVAIEEISDVYADDLDNMSVLAKKIFSQIALQIDEEIFNKKRMN